jgi:hypothetical protein
MFHIISILIYAVVSLKWKKFFARKACFIFGGALNGNKKCMDKNRFMGCFQKLLRCSNSPLQGLQGGLPYRFSEKLTHLDESQTLYSVFFQKQR